MIWHSKKKSMPDVHFYVFSSNPYKNHESKLNSYFSVKKKNEVPRGKLTQILIQVHLTFKSVWFSLTTKASVSSLLWPVNVQVKLIFIMGKKLARGSREHTFSPFDGRVTLCMVSNHPKGQRSSLSLPTCLWGAQAWELCQHRCICPGST